MRVLPLLALLAAPALAEPVAVTDTTGVEVALPGPAERVVTIDHAAYVFLADLGVRPVGAAAHDLVRTDDRLFANGEAIPNVGIDPSTPDGELVATADPDLVVGWVDEHRPMLEIVAPYYAFAGIVTVEDNLATFRDLAVLVGQEERAEAIVEAFERRAAAYAALAPSRPRALELCLLEQDRAFGIGTTAYPACGLLARVVTCDWTYPDGSPSYYETNIEGVLALDPDVVLLNPTYIRWEDLPAALERLAADPLWAELRAVREGRLVLPETPNDFNADPVSGFSLYLDWIMPRILPDAFPNGPLTDAEVAAALAE